MLRQAVDRTADWAARARRHHARLEARPDGQALFGIVQGGTDLALRAESARRTVELDFDGYAIGGLSVGEPRPAMLEVLAATVPLLPADRPRYLMGVGDPVGLVEAVALGVDQFDCVAPTRMARHGIHPDRRRPAQPAQRRPRAATTGPSTRAAAARPAPAGPGATCATCLMVGEPTAWRLLSLHNLAFVLGLMAEARAAIAEGRFDALRKQVDGVWNA